MKPVKLYIAGKYNDTNIITCLDNIRTGQRTATEALMKGFIPFCPWLDYQLFLQLRDGEHITKDQIQAYSIEWLKVSDAILMLPSWKDSGGAKAELEIALKIGLPVFWSIQEAVEYFETDDILRESFERFDVEALTGIKMKDLERITEN